MNRKWFAVIAVGLGAALIVALFSPLASSHPDGLERVAEDEEFLHKAEDPSYEILPDYTIPGIEDETLTTILSGFVGIAIVAGLCFALAFGLKALSGNRASSSSRPGAS